MRSSRMVPFAALAVGGVLLVAGCGTEEPAAPVAKAPNSAGEGGGAPAGPVVRNGTARTSNALQGTGDWAAAPGAEAEKWVQLTATRLDGVGEVLVNGAGLTLYRFDEDSAEPAKATCNDACAGKWPPVTVQAGGKVFLAGVAADDVGFVQRDDGKLQVTVGGWPVYRFAKDVRGGDVKGQGVGNTWFGVRPDGGKAGQDAEPVEKQPRDGQRSTPAKRVVLFSGFSFNVFDEDAASQVIEAGTVPDGGCVNALDPGTASSIAFDGLVKIWSGPDCTGESKQLGAVDAENVGGIADLRDIDFNNTIQSVKLPQ
ncbi:lipoprotein [Actinoplanes sp. N902-109]|uniref:lipoprotein n=1 Tax=Actinoplanes sp. (strain N902-109) TaxID=649831 RepID=UPI00032944C7|nr:lipoprotein [Actinoplanes sp. N902-109]AGL15082.1 lipoprotein [Actinoplanes sp. N902-109]